RSSRPLVDDPRVPSARWAGHKRRAERGRCAGDGGIPTPGARRPEAPAASTPRPGAEAENRPRRFDAERHAARDQGARRVTASRPAAAERSPDASLEYALNEVASSEARRHEAAGGSGRKALARWRDLAVRLGRMSEAEKRA